MAKIHIGMTKDEVIGQLALVPKGTYRVEFEELLKNKEGSPLFAGEKGIRILAALKILDNGPSQGKRVIYSCSIGSIYFSRLVNAFPSLIDGSDLDEDSVKGEHAIVEVEIDDKYDPNNPRNNVTRILPLS